MLRKSHYSHVCLAAVVAIAAITSDAQAYVTPKMGGGQMSGSMKHADIYLNGVTRVVTVHLDDTVPTPVLRPLTPPDQFDPNQPWSILNYKAYNYQIAWNPGGISGLPDGSAIWVKRLYQTPGLEVYLRPPMYVYSAANPKWTRIFATDGECWKWSGAMQHNAYAVCSPKLSVYTALYEIYVGDAITGAPVEGYTSGTVTFTWTTAPPAYLNGDMNCDGVVDGADVRAYLLALMDPSAYQAAFPNCRQLNADCNCDLAVDIADVQAFVAVLLDM